MTCKIILLRVIGCVVILLIMVGCGTSTPSPSIPQRPQPQNKQPVGPPPQTQEIHPQPVSPQPPSQVAGGQSLLKFIKTISVTPDKNYPGAVLGFCRINYVPSTDRFVVTFEARLAQSSGGCNECGYAYKEYTLDLQETGKTDVFSCKCEDSGSVMVDNTYYFVVADMSNYGWQVLKLDATNFNKVAETSISLDPKEKYTNNDPVVAFVNGQLDISSQYNQSGTWPEFNSGADSHHHYLTIDLNPLGEKILSDSPHVHGGSLIYVDGIYYFVAANSFLGDLVLMRYDTNWNYIDTKTLISKAHFSTGLVFDGQFFYLAYLDTSQRLVPDSLPVFLNVHLAIFDRDWNPVEDVAVTNYVISDNRQPGRPWVILHDNHLYVSYDEDTINPETHEEEKKSQAYISVYELINIP